MVRIDFSSDSLVFFCFSPNDHFIKNKIDYSIGERYRKPLTRHKTASSDNRFLVCLCKYVSIYIQNETSSLVITHIVSCICFFVLQTSYEQYL